MEYIIKIKTESFCEVTVNVKDVFEAISIIQCGDFVNDPCCSNYRNYEIIQNIEGIKSKNGNHVLQLKKYIK